MLSTGSYRLLVDKFKSFATLGTRGFSRVRQANFRCWPNADTLTETGNRARKVSGTQGSRFLPSEMNKQANMVNSLLSNKRLLKTNEPLLRMVKETVNVGRIKPRYLYFALDLSRFVRSGKEQQANMANPLLACPLEMNEPFLRMDERLLRKPETILRVTKPLLSKTNPLLRKTKHFGLLSDQAQSSQA